MLPVAEKNNPESVLREERRKRKITVQRNAALLKVINEFADQQKLHPKKPSETRKILEDQKDYLSDLHEYVGLASKTTATISVPTVPTIKVPPPSASPDIIAFFVTVIAALYTKMNSYLKEVEGRPEKPKKASPRTGMDKADMKLLLNRSKKAPINCAVGVSADARVALLILHKSRQPKALAKDLSKAIPGAKNLRWGTANVDADGDPKLVKFNLNKPISSLNRRLVRTLVPAGFNKVEISS